MSSFHPTRILGWALALLASSPGGIASEPSAPPDPGCRFAEHGGHAYWFCDGAASYEAAAQSCEAAGMGLATIDDEAENHFVRGKITRDAYIGLSDRNHEGSWTWEAEGRLAWCGEKDGRVPGEGYANWKLGHPQAADCHHETRDGSSYWFCRDWRSWPTALEACRSEGQGLVQIDDAAEDEFVRRRLLANAWLGGSDHDQEGEWFWVDSQQPFWTGGAHGGPVDGSYTHWDRDDPDDSRIESCLMMHEYGGDWDDEGCFELHHWVCEGPESAEPRLPDIQDCARMRPISGRWESGSCADEIAYVCEAAPADAGRSLDELADYIRDDFRTGRSGVRLVEFDEPVPLDFPFRTHGERFGLRSCIDTIEPETDPFVNPQTGTEITEYRQRYRGIPVVSGTYRVERDAASGAVRRISGRAGHDIDVETDPDVSEGAAYLRAARDVGEWWVLALLSRPRGELVVVPTGAGPKRDWHLAWQYRFPPRGDSLGQTVSVSASTGEILTRASWHAQVCTSVDLESGVSLEDELTVSAFQQEPPPDGFGDFSVAAIEASTASAETPYVLHTQGVFRSAPDSPLYDRPEIYAQCPNESYPDVVALPNDAVTVDAASDDDEFAAAQFLAVQNCLEFLANSQTPSGAPLFPNAAGGPWVGFDGFGETPIDIAIGGPYTLFYADKNLDGVEGDLYINFSPLSGTIGSPADPTIGASLEIACHELFHGIFGNLVGHRIGNRFGDEAVFLDEGLADIFGSAAEMYQRGYPGIGAPDGGPGATAGGWCFAGDQFRNRACLRNLQNPEASIRSLGCQVFDGLGNELFTTCPRDYDSPNYCQGLPLCTDSSEVNCCSDHGNSLVISHWFYVVTQGDSDINSASCPYEVAPLAADLELSVQRALQILFGALRSGRFSPEGTFEEFATLTVEAARGLYPDEPGVAQSVSDGWFAVNVLERFHRGTVADIAPPRGAASINPWQHFRWERVDGVDSWDFQLATGPFDDPAQVKFDLRDVPNPRQIAFDPGVTLALPHFSTDRFFWRFRPHQSGSWEACHPIHSVFQTLGPGEIESVEIDPPPEADGRVSPGAIRLVWPSLPNASAYRVRLAPHPVDCEDGPQGDDVIEDVVPHEFGEQRLPVSTLVGPILPEESYTYAILPIGPDRFDSADFPEGEPRAACHVGTFESGPLAPPVLVAPEPVQAFELRSPHERPSSSDPLEWSWDGLDGAESFEVRFYERDEFGQCGALPVASRTVPTRCDFVNDSCRTTLIEDVFPWDGTGLRPNATGYCWEVEASAANGATSLSHRAAFRFALPEVVKVSPGIPVGRIEIPLEPHSLGPDSHGELVTLRWAAAPDADEYMLRLGRWPWRIRGGIPSPLNCLVPSDCLDLPLERIVDSVLPGSITEIGLPGSLAGNGRYCWTVWPRFAGDRQPLVQPGEEFCYVTGPADPVIEFDQEESGGAFDPTSPITGSVTFDFLPSLPQLSLPEGATSEPSPECMVEVENDPADWDPETERWLFPDLYDCSMGLTIAEPDRRTEYQFEVTTFDAEGEPLEPLPFSFSTGSCGRVDEICCEGERYSACDDGNCEEDLCVRCGLTGDPCCDSGAICQGARVCAQDRCRDCGRAGLRCCSIGNGYQTNARCDENSFCGLDDFCHTDRVDLSVAIVEAVCTAPIPGEPRFVNIVAEVTNHSPGQDAIDALFHVGHNTSTMTNHFRTTVLAGDTVRVPVSLHPSVTASNTQNIWLRADPENDIAEIDEENNYVRVPLQSDSSGLCSIGTGDSGQPNVCPFSTVGDVAVPTTSCQEYTVDVGGSGTVEFFYNRFTVPDQITISDSTGPIYVTGCSGDPNTQSVSRAVSGETVFIEVCPNCTGTSDTDFEITASCAE